MGNSMTFWLESVSIPQGVRAGMSWLELTQWSRQSSATSFNSPRGKVWQNDVRIEMEELYLFQFPKG